MHFEIIESPRTIKVVTETFSRVYRKSYSPIKGKGTVTTELVNRNDTFKIIRERKAANGISYERETLFHGGVQLGMYRKAS